MRKIRKIINGTIYDTDKKMKKIINGTMYDTEKAIKIGTYCAPGSTTDFYWYEATLYKTPRSHRFFLAGEGGSMSHFAKYCGQDTWTGGSDIILLEDRDALKWAKKHLETEDIEEHFTIDEA